MFLSKKKDDKKRPNVFIEIELRPRRGKSYPEYNFTDLVTEQKRKMRGSSYSDDEDSKFVDPDAAEIVKRLEARYGKKKLKKARINVDDFIDKSQGYDLNDPFVDDAEIYDEYLPSTMSTSKGGFYINRGKLDFKNVHNEGDELTDDDEKKLREKKADNKRPPLIPNLKRDERAPSIPKLKRDERPPLIPNLARVNDPAIPIIKERAPPLPLRTR